MTVFEFLLSRIAEDEEQASTPRAIAECTAKRAIVGEATSNVEWAGHPDCPNHLRSLYRARGAAFASAARTIATAYADHPDYQHQEWTP